jgi:ABC-type transporter Mla subunit MlaD
MDADDDPYDHNQTLVPDAFLALHARHGRPLLSRAETEARHAACEDSALVLAARLGERGVDAEDAPGALAAAHAALAAAPDAFAAGEALWIVRRVAELMEWDPGAVPA